MIPKKIGVITSESGAVFRDIVHRIKNRFPTNLILFPVNVQGRECVSQIINMLEIIEKSEFGLDLIILARGGGSIEDLMPFNDERLVRKIYKIQIPIISAIGHETDTTLCDFVSDLRAPTPTAAAEFAVPVKEEYDFKLRQISLNLIKLIRRKLAFQQKDLKNIFPKKYWNKLHLQIIWYGREFCKARDCFGISCKICKSCYPNRKRPIKTKKA